VIKRVENLNVMGMIPSEETGLMNRNRARRNGPYEQEQSKEKARERGSKFLSI